MSLVVYKGQLRIPSFANLAPEVRARIVETLGHVGLDLAAVSDGSGALVIPQFVEHDAGRTDLAPAFGRLFNYVHPRNVVAVADASTDAAERFPSVIEFNEVNRRACVFADVIEACPEALAAILLRHESFEVVLDEIDRTLDLLRSLSENATYFQRRIGAVASFLPGNQPLYALACFGIVPAFMASEVHIKPPSSMTQLFLELAQCLSLEHHFPNVFFSRKDRSGFVKERAARHGDSALPVTDAVIFTGTMTNADKIRGRFDRRTLFIANGAGHNPIVVAEDADVAKAVAGVVGVQLYNSGQDCASPNAVLVHQRCFPGFLDALRQEVRKTRVGSYADRRTRVGPLSDHSCLPEILDVFVKNAAYLDPETAGVVHGSTGIVEPTIIVKPLLAGGNFTEHFAPIFFVQSYERDDDLALYFDDPRYAPNAMYVTVYGRSSFVDSLVSRTQSDGRPLHDESTILRDVDLHAPGIERGTRKYGGYGRGASCVSLNGQITSKPTLPQRDIFEYLVLPTITPD